MEVEDSFFEGCLVPRTEAIIMTALRQAGLPVEDIFPDYIFEESTDEGSVEPVDDGEMPF